jgi:hypothetical protein
MVMSFGSSLSDCSKNNISTELAYPAVSEEAQSPERLDRSVPVQIPHLVRQLREPRVEMRRI